MIIKQPNTFTTFITKENRIKCKEKRRHSKRKDLLKNELFNVLKRRRSSVASEEITFDSVGKKVEDK